VNFNLVKKNIIKDEWLGNILNKSVYKLNLDDEYIKKIKDKKSEENKELFEIINKKNVFIYSKIPSTSIKQTKLLEKLKFNLIDTNIVFEKDIFSQNKKYQHKIRFAKKNDEKNVKELSGKSFRFSRFHLDEQIPNKLANEIKFKWVENFFKGNRGDNMILAIVDNNIVGFLLILEKKKSIFIDLIALDEKHRGKQIGEEMIAFAENNFKDKDKIIVGTQIANTPSIRFYEKCGFRVIETYYVFHYHN
jgi:ribosomal protein S18 acetylase RimI-like enzyme